MSGYDDIMNLSHYVSQKRARMSMHDRAAQFSPFAALTGYDEYTREAARFTDEMSLLDDGVIEALNRKLAALDERINERPCVDISYFKPDSKKDGGSYKQKNGILCEINELEKKLVFDDGEEIPINNIREVRSPIFGDRFR